RSFRQADVADFARLHQFRHRTDRLLDRRLWIDAVLIIKVDRLDPEPAKTVIARLAHIIRRAVYPSRTGIGRISNDAELGGDHDAVAATANGFADEFFIRIGAVHVGGVEKIDAQI